ncbi:MAG: aminotransferase class I/II-fold pyridoxal phosphate-dependent enzyme [Clostridiales bacterium]|jgi:arginine decarboxylase|nr:aminotransferase class I/II-fold pyridoxal phosphate-dependent enzyme [Clostridiales bacterium]
MRIRNGIDQAVGRGAARFFTPGHNGGKSLSLRYDVTELAGTDNLRRPSGIIRAAEQNAAAVFGALRTYFLVNGSSVGLHALIMSVCKRGDTLIVDRNCHVSVINALVLSDIRPVYIYPAHNGAFGVSAVVAPGEVELAFRENPSAKGVLITSPTYYGVCSDIYAIAEITHKYHGTLLVDEAHGAHFPFSPLLPQSALMCCADGVVQSAHKTLPCITQGAMLHLGSGRIPPSAVRENLNLLQTTSPSYLILSSIDDAVTEMRRGGAARLANVIGICGALRDKLDATGKFRCLRSDDPTRLVIHAGEHARAAAEKLRKLHRVIIEMCDGSNLVLIVKAAHGSRDLQRLEHALLSIAQTLPPLAERRNPAPPRPAPALPPAEAYYSETEVISVKAAVGRISARAVYQTPPCVCLLAPGERVTAEVADALDGEITVTLS